METGGQRGSDREEKHSRIYIQETRGDRDRREQIVMKRQRGETEGRYIGAETERQRQRGTDIGKRQRGTGKRVERRKRGRKCGRGRGQGKGIGGEG